ncbi:MAG: DNA topoisomerase IB [Mycobacteriales bacterium]|nr:hypothetical protein [Frankia sp.]
MPRLRRIDCSAPGLVRRRAGRGFVYVDSDGAKVTDAEVLERIDALAIPPAWADVWICPFPNGHIQAMGTDAAGRRQYRYHDEWRTRRDRQKFERMIEFAQALPDLRAQVADHLRHRDLTQTRVLACATKLLDLGFFRIGTESYAVQNKTFGLATMRREHVTVTRDTIHFDYVAKSGKRRVMAIASPEVLSVVRALKRRTGGGPELLAYRGDGGDWVDVKSHDINRYVRDVAGGPFSAKDFRTWHATVLAAVALAVSTEAPTSVAARRRAVSRAVSEVAHYLGNTPAVCRASYIDPRVIDLYTSGVSVAPVLVALGAGQPFGELAVQGEIERAVLDMLVTEESPAEVPVRRSA